MSKETICETDAERQLNDERDVVGLARLSYMGAKTRYRDLKWKRYDAEAAEQIAEKAMEKAERILLEREADLEKAEKEVEEERKNAAESQVETVEPEAKPASDPYLEGLRKALEAVTMIHRDSSDLRRMMSNAIIVEIEKREKELL